MAMGARFALARGGFAMLQVEQAAGHHVGHPAAQSDGLQQCILVLQAQLLQQGGQRFAGQLLQAGLELRQ